MYKFTNDVEGFVLLIVESVLKPWTQLTYIQLALVLTMAAQLQYMYAASLSRMWLVCKLHVVASK
jgi:hypothetical protein